MLSSGRSDAVETAVRVMSMVFDRIMVQFEVRQSSDIIARLSRLLPNVNLFISLLDMRTFSGTHCN